jgi:hypothetical protein
VENVLQQKYMWVHLISSCLKCISITSLQIATYYP